MDNLYKESLVTVKTNYGDLLYVKNNIQNLSVTTLDEYDNKLINGEMIVAEFGQGAEIKVYASHINEITLEVGEESFDLVTAGLLGNGYGSLKLGGLLVYNLGKSYSFEDKTFNEDYRILFKACDNYGFVFIPKDKYEDKIRVNVYNSYAKILEFGDTFIIDTDKPYIICESIKDDNNIAVIIDKLSESGAEIISAIKGKHSRSDAIAFRISYENSDKFKFYAADTDRIFSGVTLKQLIDTKNLYKNGTLPLFGVVDIISIDKNNDCTFLLQSDEGNHPTKYRICSDNDTKKALIKLICSRYEDL